MTAVCGGGTSAPKVAAAAVVDYSAGLLAAIFAAYDLAWLIPIIPFVGLAPLTLSTFCGSDPPAVPTFTSAETNAVLKLQFGPDFDSGLAKLKDLVLNVIWYDACHCTSGALVPLTPPAMPVGTPVFQPPVPPTNTPCDSVPQRTVTSFVGPSPGLLTSKPITYVVFRWTNTILGGAGGTYQVNLGQWFSQANPGPTLTFLAQTQYFISPGESQKQVVKVAAGTNFVRPDVTFSSGSGTSTIQYSIDGYCGDAPPGAIETPCCPPDLATQASLDLILKMVTLIQRQSVPFAYLASTAHAGISGTGSIAIQGLLGVKVEVTTLPASLGVSGTSPAEHFDLGFITFGTTDGYPHSIRLEHQVQLMLPARCSVFTTLAYDLHPGVQVTITELLREP